MTTETLTEAPHYTVAGIGPYHVPHAYSRAADLIVMVRAPGGDLADLDQADWSINPATSDGSGDITLTADAAAVHAGASLVIARWTLVEQGWVGQAAREKGLERQVDRQARAIQDILADLRRVPHLPRDSATSPTLPVPVPGVLLGHASGATFDHFPISAFNSGVVSEFEDEFVGNGIVTDFALTWNPVSGALAQVYVNGVRQDRPDDWSFVTPGGAPTVRFVAAPRPGDVIHVKYIVPKQTSAATDGDLIALADGQSAQAAIYDRAPLYASRAAAQAALVPLPVTRILVRHAGRTCAYVRDGAGTALTTAGGVNWRPDGRPSPEHFGAYGDDATDDRAALNLFLAIGGDLELDAGRSYYFTNVLFLAANTHLFGRGTLRAGPASGFTDTTSNSHRAAVLGNLVDNVRIEGIHVDTSAWTAPPPGAASVRAVHFFRSNTVTVTGCRGTVASGFVSANGGSDHLFAWNDVTVVPMGAETHIHADGVIDTWPAWGVEIQRSIIAYNRIRGGGVARWGVMATADFVDTSNMVIEGLIITGNIVEDCIYDGVWAFGRDAALNSSSITNNIVRRCRKGISLSDARGCVVTGNVVEDTTGPGIHLWRETGAGGTLGCEDNLVYGNVLRDVASGLSGQPSAIWVEDGQNNSVYGNRVVGNTHYYGLTFGGVSTGNREWGNHIDTPRVGGAKRLFSAPVHAGGATYTPTLTGVDNTAAVLLRAAHYYCQGDMCVVHVRFNVTPSAGAANCNVRCTLPIASDIVDETLFGSGSTNTLLAVHAYNDNSNDAALIRYLPVGTGEVTIAANFSYRIR